MGLTTLPHQLLKHVTVGYFNLQQIPYPGLRLWLDANNINGDTTADSIADGTPIVNGLTRSRQPTMPGQAER